MKLNRFYVYLHRDLENVVRFVGVGTGPKKFKSATGRSKDWNTFLSKGATYQIMKENISKEEAESLKVSFMNIYKDTVLNKKLPTKPLALKKEYFDKYFQLDPESPTGLILKDSDTDFKAIGKPCGYMKKPGSKSYWAISKDNIEYYVHRIVYTLYHGDFDPNLIINHIDGNGLNNSIENLELVTLRLNSLECKDSKNSTTGHNGVVLHRDKEGNIGGAVARYPTDSFTTKTKFFNLKKYGTIEKCVELAANFHKIKKDALIEKLRNDFELQHNNKGNE